MTDGNTALTKVFELAPFLARRFARDNQAHAEFMADPFALTEKSAAQIRAELAAELGGLSDTNDIKELVFKLKRYKYRQYLRLTARELLLHDQREIYREFSHLAQIIGEILLMKLYRAECVKLKLASPCPLAIIALGKLGGMELNYSSDIDVVGLYDQDAELETRTAHEFACKLFATWGNLMSAHDEHGFLYRVDWDLRPEGKSGVLANSLTAMESYYSAFGAEWERQAFIKARVLIAHGTLGDRFISMMTPFVYRKHLDEGALQRTLDMKAKITAHHEAKSGGGIDIKNGSGGLRDIEFIAQGLQLVHGGNTSELRRTGTLDALSALDRGGFLDTTVAGKLSEAYLFLRRAESAVQMEEERQTHTVKTSPESWLALARRMGFALSDASDVAVCSEQLQLQRDYVSLVFTEMYDGK